ISVWGMGPDPLPMQQSRLAVSIGEYLISVAAFVGNDLLGVETAAGKALGNPRSRQAVAQVLGAAYIDDWRVMNVNKEQIDMAAELAMQEASSRLNALAAEQPAGLADSVRHELAVAAAQYSFRQAARQEQLRVYELASYSAVETAVIPLIPAGVQAPIENLIAALHSLYILAGIDEYYLVNVHFNHPYTDAEPLSALRA